MSISSYEDIIDLPHPTSKTHPRMSLLDRAAQFSPFAALTGHSAAVEETARQTDCKKELSDDEKEQIDRKLQLIRDRLSEDQPRVRIVYFVPDTLKEGGKYVSMIGLVRKFDEIERKLIFEDGTVINVEDILDAEFFNEMQP